jgi:hypothetical protein
MPARVVDGKLKFGVGLQEWHNRPIIREALLRRGILVPRFDDVATDAEPARAFINPLDGQARWVAACPACGPSAITYAWIGGPHVQLCWACGNRGIGGRWRPVVVPANYREIERLILKRPPLVTINGRLYDPRAWAGESIEQVKADNEIVGV